MLQVRLQVKSLEPNPVGFLCHLITKMKIMPSMSWDHVLPFFSAGCDSY